MGAALAPLLKPAGEVSVEEDDGLGAMAPFLVAPKESTFTPAFQVISAGVQPRCTSALAKRAPSMCSGSRWALAAALSAAISSAV